MAQLVNLPDGSQASFPDGTPPDVMKGAIQKRFPPVAAGAADQTPAKQRYDAAIQAVIDANPHASPDDIAALKQHYGPSNLMDLAQAGTTFGLSDELAGVSGGLKAMLSGGNFGDAYHRWSELQAAREELGRQQTGIPGAVVEGGTSLLSIGPEKAALDALINGTRAAAPSLLRAGLTGAGTGGALGGVAGFTSTDGDVTQRLEGGARGAGIGAVVGAATPLVMQGIGAGVDNVTQALLATRAANDIGINPEAARFLHATLAADDALSPAGAQRMTGAGNEAMLADAGPSARNALDFAIQSSGRAGQVAQQAIGERVGRDAGAIRTALDTTLGPAEGVNGLRADVRTQTAPARDAAYQRAYAQLIDYASPDGQALEGLLHRVPPAAVTRANNLMHVEGVAGGHLTFALDNNGQVVFRQMPNVRQLDYITRALNEEASAGIGAGAMGGQTSLGSALGNLSGEIRDTLRLHVPEYGDALAVGQQAIQRSQAIQRGYEALRPSTTREDVATGLQNLTQGDRAAMAQGVRSHIDDVVSNVTRTVTDGDVPAREAIKTLRDLSTTANRDKVAQIVGQQEADTLFAELDRATQSFELRASVADNSRTFQRQEMSRRAGAMTSPQGILATLARGEPVNAGKRVVQAITGMTPERELANRDMMMQDVVRALVAQHGAGTQIAQRLATLTGANTRSGQIAQALMATGPIGGPAAYLSGGQAGGRPQ